MNMIGKKEAFPVFTLANMITRQKKVLKALPLLNKNHFQACTGFFLSRVHSSEG